MANVVIPNITISVQLAKQSSPPVDIKLKDVKKAEKELKERDKQERRGGFEGNWVSGAVLDYYSWNVSGGDEEHTFLKKDGTSSQLQAPSTQKHQRSTDPESAHSLKQQHSCTVEEQLPGTQAAAMLLDKGKDKSSLALAIQPLLPLCW